MTCIKLPWVLGNRINEDFSESVTGTLQEINTGAHSGAIHVVVRMRDDDEDLPSGIAAANLAVTAPDLLAELRAAHQIIRNALNLMTADQKIEWSRANDRDGVHGVGITRANEREAVIAKATGAK